MMASGFSLKEAKRLPDLSRENSLYSGALKDIRAFIANDYSAHYTGRLLFGFIHKLSSGTERIRSNAQLRVPLLRHTLFAILIKFQ